jgi:hypothetical protein
MINPLTGASVRLRQICLTILLASLGGAATAGTLSCPDLAKAVQVNACPTDDELRTTYSGFCSDSAKAYANQTDSCIRYEDYREMKNVAMWESKDGVFSSYVSCNLPARQGQGEQGHGNERAASGQIDQAGVQLPQRYQFHLPHQERLQHQQCQHLRRQSGDVPGHLRLTPEASARLT